MIRTQKNHIHLTLLILLFITAGCEIIVDNAGNGCVNCHTDKELLKEIADPIETTEDTGEG